MFVVYEALAVSVTASAATLLGWALMDRATVTAEFGNGKRHASKERTGVFAVAARRAFLVGNTVICGLYKKLGGALEPYYREYTEGNVEARTVCYYTRLATKAAFYLFGELAAFTGLAGAVAIADPCTEYYGLYRFDNGDGITVGYRVEVSDAAEGVFRAGGEGYGVSFTAVKDHVLFKYRNSREELTVSYSETSLCLYLDVVANNYLIEALIEGDFVCSDVSPKKLGGASSDACGVCKDLLGGRRDIYARILKAISVTAAIQNAHCVYANRSSAVAVKTEACIFIFLHYDFSLI